MHSLRDLEFLQGIPAQRAQRLRSSASWIPECVGAMFGAGGGGRSGTTWGLSGWTPAVMDCRWQPPRPPLDRVLPPPFVAQVWGRRFGAGQLAAPLQSSGNLDRSPRGLGPQGR